MTRVFALLLASTAPAFAADVTYEADGRQFGGYFADADNAKGTVLIVHDWDGLGDYEKQRADMLAEMGYDAMAIDVFGTETPTETMDHRRAAMGEAFGDRERLRGLLASAIEQARGAGAEGDIVVMGYCFGGAVTLEMARSDMADQAAGYATFHGGLGTPEGQKWDGDEPPILVMHGASDTSITMDDVEMFTNELNEAGNTFTVEVYSGAPHAFTVFGSDRYQERADTESWQAFSDFLGDNLGS